VTASDMKVIWYYSISTNFLQFWWGKTQEQI